MALKLRKTFFMNKNSDEYKIFNTIVCVLLFYKKRLRQRMRVPLQNKKIIKVRAQYHNKQKYLYFTKLFGETQSQGIIPINIRYLSLSIIIVCRPPASIRLSNCTIHYFILFYFIYYFLKQAIIIFKSIYSLALYLRQAAKLNKLY